MVNKNNQKLCDWSKPTLYTGPAQNVFINLFYHTCTTIGQLDKTVFVSTNI